MQKRAVFASVGLGLLVAANIWAADLPSPVRSHSIIHGGNAAMNKAAGDTIDLMGPSGSGALHLGDFEDGWNGWTSIDRTQVAAGHWQVSDYAQPIPGNLAAWCGSLEFASCNDSLDGVGGYGDNWDEQLVWRLAVPDPLQAATVHVAAALENDTEPAYDFTYLSVAVEGQIGFTDLQTWNGKGSYAVDQQFVYMPSDLVGGTDVVVAFRFRSDGGGSDANCLFYGMGAVQIDDIVVTVSQVGQADVVSSSDFQDGTFGDWVATVAEGVGDFAALWSGLEDADQCATNYSQQAAFIDDGVVVPGTGGGECINWCYGPMGYIVNTTGGLAGPLRHIQNDILSPVMAWPNDAFDGATLAFDVFVHEDLSADSPGIFYVWGVRSADTDGSAGNGVHDISNQPFRDRNFVYYGGPEYRRVQLPLIDLLKRGRDEIQISLGIWELGWAWGWIGDDGYPAPYFDNVSLKVFPFEGPAITAKPEDLAQSSFPESDILDFANPGSMHVRFDAARNISPAGHMRNDPGDSVVIDIVPVRAGAALAGQPEFHYTIDANPDFDAFRTTATTGMVLGSPAVGSSGIPDPDGWAFDLPDTGTLFPGDVMHYYVRAGDDVAGNIVYATMPEDLTGYGDFDGPIAYDVRFIFRALPSLDHRWDDIYDSPPILVWDDGGDPAEAQELYSNLIYMGYEHGVMFDFYYTQAAGRGLGNGLGGRTAGASLRPYSTIIYTSGRNTEHTLSSGDFDSDPGDDIGAMENWLASSAQQNLFLSGDGLASDLNDNQGAAGIDFLNTVMGVDRYAAEVRPFINNQVSPLVITVPSTSVFGNRNRWTMNGGCPDPRIVDAVTVRAGAERLAEFSDPSGAPGAYGFSAATLNYHDGSNHVVSVPYDLSAVTWSNPSTITAPTFSGLWLADVLNFFGYYVRPPVPEASVFAVSSHPNPFNPLTQINYTVESPGHLVLKIYNLRGELVRTLIDAEVQTSGHVVWDGTDGSGARVSSGVYFREARMGGEVSIGKMALIK